MDAGLAKVVVFDFDGTLVQSNQLKFDAYFKLFPRDERHGLAISKVLDGHFEETRYKILERILKELGETENIKQRVLELASGYNDMVLAGAKTCPQVGRAEEMLKSFSVKYDLYLSSTTPEEALREIISHRGWQGYFKEICGHPRDKTETLRRIMDENSIGPHELVVIGDGESDRASAENVGCPFIHIDSGHGFLKIRQPRASRKDG